MAATKTKKKSWSDEATRTVTDAHHLEGMKEAAAKVDAKADKVVKIALPDLEVGTARLRLVGDSPLIVNRFSEKAIQMMEDKQGGKASAGREPKDPVACYEAARYLLLDDPKGRDGFPAIAFKNAAVEACTSLGKSVITKVAARQAFHVVGHLLPIDGKPKMQRDMVRVGQGTADIRYRPVYDPWSIIIEIVFNSRVMTASQLVNLINIAGFAVGVGEWRPERNGCNGRFHVDLSFKG